jgi:hypothetical protein
MYYKANKLLHLLIHNLYKLGLLESPICLKIQGFAAGRLHFLQLHNAIKYPAKLQIGFKYLQIGLL